MRSAFPKRRKPIFQYGSESTKNCVQDSILSPSPPTSVKANLNLNEYDLEISFLNSNTRKNLSKFPKIGFILFYNWNTK